MKHLNLQLFAEGGDAGSAPAESGIANPSGETGEPALQEPQSKADAFEALIKGEYKEEFNKRTQEILNKRFKANKQEQARHQSADDLVSLMAERYGVDPTDHNAIRNAMDADTHYLEQEALEQGLSVKQLQHIKQMEREIAKERNERENIERQRRADEIYARWQQESQEVSEKYGRPIDIEEEIQNPQFLKLISDPSISFESAYKVVHMDELMGGAMAVAAENARNGVANSIRSRSGRPAENGAGSKSGSGMKIDVSKLTKQQRAEYIQRAARGQNVSL